MNCHCCGNGWFRAAAGVKAGGGGGGLGDSDGDGVYGEFEGRLPIHMNFALGFGVGFGSIGAGEEFSIATFEGR